MPHENVFTLINREYYQLTAAEKRIADHILLHQTEVQFRSISELAEMVGVAEATVSRFCRRLGYKGYNTFKLAVANSNAGNRSVSNPLAGEVLPEDSVEDMCQKVCSADIEAISQTQALIRPDDIVRAADILLNARRVCCMGQGGSMILAQETAHLFSTVLPDFYPIQDSHMQIVRASMMDEKDAIIYFSYSGATKDLLDMVKVTREQGTKLILVTRFPQSPGAAYADVVLECGSMENPLQLGSVAARIAQLYLVDVLFSEVCRRDISGCRERRKQVADALADKHI